MPFTHNQAVSKAAQHYRLPILITGLLTSALGVVLLTASANVSAGQIYKWVDTEGNVHYTSQKPTDNSAEQMNVNTAKTGVNRGAAALDKLKQQADDEAQRVKEEGIPAQPPVPSLSMKQVKQRCQTARRDLATIQSRGQLRERDDKGNTRYLSDKERQQRIKRAKDQIREYCN